MLDLDLLIHHFLELSREFDVDVRRTRTLDRQLPVRKAGIVLLFAVGDHESDDRVSCVLFVVNLPGVDVKHGRG